MSSLGLQFANQESLSPTRMDSKTLFWGTGEEISLLPQSSEVKLAFCIETGSGFVENTLYTRSFDGTTWYPVFRKHLHDSDTDEAGGTLADLWRANQHRFKNFKFHDIRQIKGSSIDAQSPAHAQVNLNQTSYMDFSTGPNVDDYTNFWTNEGVRIDLSRKFSLSFKMQLSHDADLVFRFGCGPFLVQNAISPSNMVWVEGCDASGTNIVAGASNGLAITTQASSQPMVPDPNTSVGHRLDFIPATKVIFSTDGGGSGVELNTNIPSSSYIPTENTIKGGIQTKNTTAKSLFIFLAELSYELGGDESWI